MLRQLRQRPAQHRAHRDLTLAEFLRDLRVRQAHQTRHEDHFLLFGRQLAKTRFDARQLFARGRLPARRIDARVAAHLFLFEPGSLAAHVAFAGLPVLSAVRDLAHGGRKQPLPELRFAAKPEAIGIFEHIPADGLGEVATGLSCQ